MERHFVCALSKRRRSAKSLQRERQAYLWALREGIRRAAAFNLHVRLKKSSEQSLHGRERTGCHRRSPTASRHIHTHPKTGESAGQRSCNEGREETAPWCSGACRADALMSAEKKRRKVVSECGIYMLSMLTDGASFGVRQPNCKQQRF